MKELRENFLRTLQAFRLAALPMRNGVSVVEPLDAAPGKGTDFYRFARQCASDPIKAVLVDLPIFESGEHFVHGVDDFLRLIQLNVVT